MGLGNQRRQLKHRHYGIDGSYDRSSELETVHRKPFAAAPKSA